MNTGKERAQSITGKQNSTTTPWEPEMTVAYSGNCSTVIVSRAKIAQWEKNPAVHQALGVRKSGSTENHSWKEVFWAYCYD